MLLIIRMINEAVFDEYFLVSSALNEKMKYKFALGYLITKEGIASSSIRLRDYIIKFRPNSYFTLEVVISSTR